MIIRQRAAKQLILDVTDKADYGPVTGQKRNHTACTNTTPYYYASTKTLNVEFWLYPPSSMPGRFGRKCEYKVLDI